MRADVFDLIPDRPESFETALIGGLPRHIVQGMQLMNLDLTALKSAAAAHTVEMQRLLEASAARASAADNVARAFSAAQAEVDGIVTEIANQTAAIKSFNDANPNQPQQAS